MRSLGRRESEHLKRVTRRPLPGANRLVPATGDDNLATANLPKSYGSYLDVVPAEQRRMRSPIYFDADV